MQPESRPSSDPAWQMLARNLDEERRRVAAFERALRESEAALDAARRGLQGQQHRAASEARLADCEHRLAHLDWALRDCQRQRDETRAERDAVLASTSWRLTGPLRWLAGPVRLRLLGVLRRLVGGLRGLVRRLLRALAVRAARIERLRQPAVGLIKRFPFLERRLRGLLGQTATPVVPPAESETAVADDLSAEASAIYRRLSRRCTNKESR